MSSEYASAQGLLIVLSGPSGAGKSTLVSAARQSLPALEYSVSFTTRAPRGQEVHGQDYFFVDSVTFEAMAAQGEFAEWALVHGNRYGTSKAFVEARLAAGKYVLLDIDVQGAAKIKAWRNDAIFIFCAPPTPEELALRLRRRATDSEDVISRRLFAATEEVQQAAWYDYVVVNDALERAIIEFTAILRAEGARRVRMAPPIRALFQAFGVAEGPAESAVLNEEGAASP